MLENLLNTKPKRKLLSEFFAFPQRSFTIQELQKSVEMPMRTATETIRELIRSDVLRVVQKNRHRLFSVNQRFPLYQELTDMLQDEMADRDDLLASLCRKLPQAKLVILSGMFTAQPNLPVDLLIIGDRVGRLRLSRILAEIEKLIGLEVVYTIIPESEYEYRRLMNDRFIRDILDYPHLSILPKQKGKRR